MKFLSFFLSCALSLFSWLPVQSQDFPPSWWEKLSSNNRLYLYNDGRTINWVRDNLDSLQQQGYRMLEVFAPWNSTHVYSGLAMTDFYTINPALGTKADLEALVNFAHLKNMPITVFLNLGYSSLEAPFFLKACDDAKNGISSKEREWFLFSDNNLALPDVPATSYFVQEGYWVYSNRAGKYYWSKWDNQPQFNYASLAWQEECKKIIRFYMDMGFDGMVVDAVNFYTNISWELNNQCITDVIREYPNSFIQPEGAGAFGDEPVGWITQGHYNCIQNYHTGIWWNNWSIFWEAITTQNASIINTRVREYRDRVVNAGGITYIYPLWEKTLSTTQRMLEIAAIISTGNLFVQSAGGVYNHEMEAWSKGERLQYKALLDAANEYPALHPGSRRSVVPTNNDNRFLAQLRSASNGQKVLSVLNFSGSASTATIHVSEAGIPSGRIFRDMLSGEIFPLEDIDIKCTMPSWGYRFFLVECDEPGILLDAQACSYGASLSWSTCQSCCDTFFVERAEENGSFIKLAGPLTDKWFADVSGTTGTNYCYKVSAQHADSIVYSYPACIRTANILPALPGFETDEGNVKLQWSAWDGAQAYSIWRADSSGEKQFAGITPFTSYLDSPGPGSYTYTLIAEDACGSESDPSEPLDVQVYETTSSQIEDNAPGWSGSKDFAPLPKGCAANGSTRVGWRYNEYTEYAFTGTKVKVFGTKFPQGKTADILLDGKKYSDISFYNNSELCGTLIWSSPDLTPGKHTIRFVVKGDWIEIDYLKVVSLKTGLSTMSIPEEPVLFPNPCRSEFFILTSGNITPDEISITDITGRVLLKKKTGFSGNRIGVNTMGLLPGQYLVQLRTGGRSWVKPLQIM